MAPSDKCIRWSSFTVAAFSLLFVIVAWVLPEYIEKKLDQGIHESTSLSAQAMAQNTRGYASWNDSTSADATPIFYRVWLYNYTNTHEIVRGGVAQVESVGPYVFTKSKRLLNVTFSPCPSGLNTTSPINASSILSTSNIGYDPLRRCYARYYDWTYYNFEAEMTLAESNLTGKEILHSPNMVFQALRHQLASDPEAHPDMAELFGSLYSDLNGFTDETRLFWTQYNAIELAWGGFEDRVLAEFSKLLKTNLTYPGLLTNTTEAQAKIDTGYVDLPPPLNVPPTPSTPVNHTLFERSSLRQDRSYRDFCLSLKRAVERSSSLEVQAPVSPDLTKFDAIFTGEDDPSLAHQYYQYQGEQYLTVPGSNQLLWTTAQASLVSGTDTILVPPSTLGLANRADHDSEDDNGQSPPTPLLFSPPFPLCCS